MYCMQYVGICISHTLYSSSGIVLIVSNLLVTSNQKSLAKNFEDGHIFSLLNLHTKIKKTQLRKKG